MKCVICKTGESRDTRGYCEQCVAVSELGYRYITSRGIDEILVRIQRLEKRHTDGVIKVKSNAIVNENISAELGIPDAKDIITIQCAGRDYDGQWVRRSSYNELSDEAGRRDKQRKQALEELVCAKAELHKWRSAAEGLERERDEADERRCRELNSARHIGPLKGYGVEINILSSGYIEQVCSNCKRWFAIGGKDIECTECRRPDPLLLAHIPNQDRLKRHIAEAAMRSAQSLGKMKLRDWERFGTRVTTAMEIIIREFESQLGVRRFDQYETKDGDDE